MHRVQTRSLPSYSLSKLFLISAGYGVASFTPWFSCSGAPFHRIGFPAAALYMKRFAGRAHSVEEFARRVYGDELWRESANNTNYYAKLALKQIMPRLAYEKKLLEIY